VTEVIRITFKQAFDDPDFTTLFDEYCEESAMNGMPQPVCQPAIYQQIEDAGIMHVLGAYDDDRMVGFLNLLVNTLPHYGKLVATTESYFVGFKHRKGGAGLMLLREAERLATTLGAVGILVSSPNGSKLAEVMPKVGYTAANQVFFRSLQ
jgi:hypothetical protein